MAVFIVKDKTSYRPNFNVHGSIKKHLVYIVFLRVLQIPSGPLEILSDFALQNILLMQAKCYVIQGQVVAWGCQWEKANEHTHKAQRYENIAQEMTSYSSLDYLTCRVIEDMCGTALRVPSFGVSCKFDLRVLVLSWILHKQKADVIQDPPRQVQQAKQRCITTLE